MCLSDVVLWLLEQCGRPQTECRHKCMELFYEFVPLLPGKQCYRMLSLFKINSFFKIIFSMFFVGKKSLPQWFESMLENQGVAFLTSQFEGGGLLSQPTLRVLMGPFSVRATLQWMDLLLASLDCYTTFINLHIIKPHHMISKLKVGLYTVNTIIPSRNIAVTTTYLVSSFIKCHIQENVLFCRQNILTSS